MALTDPLTDLPNRRAIDLWVDRQLSAAARHDFPVWVAIADLDHFKKVNDTFGHEAGDVVLKKFAEVLKANTRRSNICGRLGGEEFVLILTHVQKEQVAVAMDRIRKRLELIEFKFGPNIARVTASFGIGGFSGSRPPDFNKLLTEADAALYAAKHKGRNRIEFGSAVI
jgi:diguanylate cyclase